MFDDSDAYEFDVPEELREWLNFQRENNPLFQTFILVNGKITKANMAEAALCWSDIKTRRVDFTKIGEDIEVSTVFLPFDHNFANLLEKWEEEPKDVDLRPILFETLVFGGVEDGRMRRYVTMAEAKKGHWETVDLVNQSLKEGGGL